MARPNNFRTSNAENIFYEKYAISRSQTWWEKCQDIVADVCGPLAKRGGHALLSKSEREYLAEAIYQKWFLPGGRYIYYAGRGRHFFNNCFLLIGEEDTREEWAKLAHNSTSALMSGGGIGIDYSVFRESGRTLSGTGGIASGPIALMKMINEIGRNVMQGGKLA